MARRQCFRCINSGLSLNDIRKMEKLDNVHPGEILEKDFMDMILKKKRNTIRPIRKSSLTRQPNWGALGEVCYFTPLFETSICCRSFMGHFQWQDYNPLNPISGNICRRSGAWRYAVRIPYPRLGIDCIYTQIFSFWLGNGLSLGHLKCPFQITSHWFLSAIANGPIKILTH